MDGGADAQQYHLLQQVLNAVVSLCSLLRRARFHLPAQAQQAGKDCVAVDATASGCAQDCLQHRCEMVIGRLLSTADRVCEPLADAHVQHGLAEQVALGTERYRGQERSISHLGCETMQRAAVHRRDACAARPQYDREYCRDYVVQRDTASQPEQCLRHAGAHGVRRAMPRQCVRAKRLFHLNDSRVLRVRQLDAHGGAGSAAGPKVAERQCEEPFDNRSADLAPKITQHQVLALTLMSTERKQDSLHQTNRHVLRELTPVRRKVLELDQPQHR